MGDLRMVPTDAIVVPEHRRRRRERTELEGTKASIAEIGIQQPLKLALSSDGKYELVAGEGRWLCARELALPEVPAFIEESDPMKDVAARVAENMAREELSPADEAEEIKALLDAGYRPEQVSAIANMPKKRVTARMVLVALPEELRKLYQHGGLPASSAPTLKELHDGNPRIAQTLARVAQRDSSLVADAVADGAGWALSQVEHLMRRVGLKGNPPFVVSLRRGDNWGRKVRWRADDPGRIKLKGDHGEWFTQLAQAGPEWDRPNLVFTDEDLDAAVAVGAAFSEAGEHGQVWIHDRAWLTEHVNAVVLPRMRNESEQAAAAKAATEQAARAGSGDLSEVSPLALASKLQAKFTRELKPRAHSANLDLGTTLIKQLATAPLTREVALFFAHEAIGAAGDRFSYDGGHARTLAECAARTLPNWIRVEKTELKGGRVTETPVYLDGEAAETRMWRFIDEARSAEEVLGRTLIMFAAAARFQRECGAAGKTPQNHLPHNAKAAKALGPLIARAVPASVKRLEREKRKYDSHAEATAMIADAKKQRPAQKRGKRSAGAGQSKPATSRRRTSQASSASRSDDTEPAAVA